MALDGIVLAALKKELHTKLTGGRVTKIQQPEKAEVLLTIKKEKDTYRLLLSADASLPMAYLTESQRKAPDTAPLFCMVMRKYLGNGRVTAVTQPKGERILIFHVEHMDEMGDLREYRLILEIMGRHSNLILVDDQDKILDSIKRVPADVSSVRIVLPGETYEMPPGQGKKSPAELSPEEFRERLHESREAVPKTISGMLTGVSFPLAESLAAEAERSMTDDAAEAGNFARKTGAELTDSECMQIAKIYEGFRNRLAEEDFFPVTYLLSGEPKEYHVFPLAGFAECEKMPFESISALLEDYYSGREKRNLMRQKTADMKHVLEQAVARAAKKLDLQRQQLRDTEDREKDRIRGELLQTYGYGLQGGEKELECENYYDGTTVKIPLDPQKTAFENSQSFFARYNKKKRAAEALAVHIRETEEELDYARSALHALSLCDNIEDIKELRQEMAGAGILKKTAGKKGKDKTPKAKPLHYVTADGYDIYIGKNNLQNDELSFKLAEGKDMWFHAKQIPGSHVIVRRKGKEDLPDSVYLAAASLAAYYSSAKDNPKVEIDYTEKKELKKPPAAKPGYVIYHTNWSMMAVPAIPEGVQLVEE